MAVDTPGGRIHVQWDHGASATPNSQLAFFAEFFSATSVYEAWLESCPLVCTSPKAPSKKDVLGTLLLAIIAGHNRYAQITGLRGDALSAQILGMHKIISESDWSPRRASFIRVRSMSAAKMADCSLAVRNLLKISNV